MNLRKPYLAVYSKDDRAGVDQKFGYFGKSVPLLKRYPYEPCVRHSINTPHPKHCPVPPQECLIWLSIEAFTSDALHIFLASSFGDMFVYQL